MCQLDTLRERLARNVERVLNERPESLDETYARVLREISKSNREDVFRLLQCIVVFMCPLRVEELAEVLAVDFVSDKGIPKSKPDWRWEDQEQALHAACSSLIATVDYGYSRVVEFSHFSVKEFLTSPRLAASSGDISRYYISIGPAHTILAQACISVLLRLNDRVSWYGIWKSFPLAEYAAEHWVKHVQFEDMSSHIREGMEVFFNPDSPYFAARLRLHDIDTFPYGSTFSHHSLGGKWEATPLYYADLCGFHDLIGPLIVSHPQHVNACGGYCYSIPLVAALAGNYFQIAELLLQHGANVHVRRFYGWTPLHSAAREGCTEIVGWLLNHGADANAQEGDRRTPLHFAAIKGHVEVARILLEHNADIEAVSRWGTTPFHKASERGHLDFVRLLLGHGVDVNARDDQNLTPLHRASSWGEMEVTR